MHARSHMRHLSVSPPRFTKSKYGARFFDAFLDQSVYGYWLASARKTLSECISRCRLSLSLNWTYVTSFWLHFDLQVTRRLVTANRSRISNCVPTIFGRSRKCGWPYKNPPLIYFVRLAKLDYYFSTRMRACRRFQRRFGTLEHCSLRTGGVGEPLEKHRLSACITMPNLVALGQTT